MGAVGMALDRRTEAPPSDAIWITRQTGPVTRTGAMPAGSGAPSACRSRSRRYRPRRGGTGSARRPCSPRPPDAGDLHPLSVHDRPQGRVSPCSRLRPRRRTRPSVRRNSTMRPTYPYEQVLSATNWRTAAPMRVLNASGTPSSFSPSAGSRTAASDGVAEEAASVCNGDGDWGLVLGEDGWPSGTRQPGPGTSRCCRSRPGCRLPRCYDEAD